MKFIYLVLAAMTGGLGTVIGGTQTFILTGFIGIMGITLQLLGHDMTFFNYEVSNLLFLPAVIFNGAVVGTAYAARKYEIRGFETGRSLGFTSDPIVFLMGCIGGLAGYLLFNLATYCGFTCDQGSFSVIAVGIITRLLFNQEQKYNRRGLMFIEQGDLKYWTFLILFSISLSVIIGYFTEKTKLYTVGFSLSALTLVFGLTDPSFPATHHLTLVAGYAMMYTHSLIWAVVFGVLSEVLCDMFARVLNTECGTHVDPPAFAILVCSFIIFTFF